MFAVNRDDALANFSGRFGKQLLQPCAQIRNAGRSNDRDFVAPRIRGRSENDAQHGAGIFLDAHGRSAGRTISAARSRNFFVSRPITAAGTMPKFDSAE